MDLTRPWLPKARCRTEFATTKEALDLFFSLHPAKVEVAKAWCQSCPVQAECLTDALADPSDADGVRGGLTYPERKRLRRRQVA